MYTAFSCLPPAIVPDSLPIPTSSSRIAVKHVWDVFMKNKEK